MYASGSPGIEGAFHPHRRDSSGSDAIATVSSSTARQCGRSSGCVSHFGSTTGAANGSAEATGTVPRLFRCSADAPMVAYGDGGRGQGSGGQPGRSLVLTCTSMFTSPYAVGLPGVPRSDANTPAATYPYGCGGRDNVGSTSVPTPRSS